MDFLIKNEGAKHIAEKIFNSLNTATIFNLRLVNRSCKDLVEEPVFLTKKIIGTKESWMDVAKQIKMVQTSSEAYEKALQYLPKEYLDSNQLQKTYSLSILFRNADYILFLRSQKYPLFEPIHIVGKKEFYFAKFLLNIQPQSANAWYKHPNFTDKYQPIHFAIMNNDIEVVKILSDFMKNPLMKTTFSTLDMAIHWGHLEIVEYLIQFENDLTDSIKSTIAYQVLDRFKEPPDNLRMLELFLKTKKYDLVRCRDMLYQAIRTGKIEVLKLILQNVEDPLNVNYYGGVNPIQICQSFKPKGFEKIIELFKDYKDPGSGPAHKKPKITNEQ